MPPARSPGRPRSPLPPPPKPLTRRIRRLVDLVHRGNLAEAARATGVAYPTLRDLYVGRTVNPGLETLEALSRPYGIEVTWLTGEQGADEVPITGIRVLLPPHPRTAPEARAFREVLIPHAARPMTDIVARLDQWLSTQRPGPERPIVGEATGDAQRFRLTTFLLQPLLAAEKLGEPDVIPSARPGERLADEAQSAWIARLRALGEMWQAALAALLARVREPALQS